MTCFDKDFVTAQLFKRLRYSQAKTRKSHCQSVRRIKGKNKLGNSTYFPETLEKKSEKRKPEKEID